jgi:EAL domain-containing protein (putative c-di-GMP-specific phosphodiesterase class I)
MKDSPADDEPRLHYQPIVLLESGDVISAEALLRGGSAEAIATDAEKNGKIFTLDRTILLRACRDANEWRAKGLADVAVHVNVSALELRSAKLLDAIDGALEASGLPAESLNVEITETSAVDDLKLAGKLLDQLESRGVGCWLDDFGTGHSNLKWLRDLRVEGLKIPRELLPESLADERSRLIVRRTIEMAHELGMKVVAEGIETEEQIEFLRECGCEALQGYFFAEPVTAKELLAEVGRRKGRDSGREKRSDAMRKDVR